MANYCTNALVLHNASEAEINLVESVFDGTFVNRIDEITWKLRKIFLAGACGLLLPHKSTDTAVIDLLEEACPLLIKGRFGDSEASLAYSEFLALFINGELKPGHYDEIDSIYHRTGIHNVYFGDIPIRYRKAMKRLWKDCSETYFDENRRTYEFNQKIGIDAWWSHQVAAPINSAKEEKFDMRVLTPVPVRVLVSNKVEEHYSGHGRITPFFSTMSKFFYYKQLFGNKMYVTDAWRITGDGSWSFDSAWSPVRELSEIIPKFLKDHLGEENEDLSVDIAYFEGGMGFQGVNDDVYDYVCIYDEDDDSDSGLHPDVQTAFGY